MGDDKSAKQHGTISVPWPTGGNSVQNGDVVQFTVSTPMENSRARRDDGVD
jgi:hypothetical protein